MDLSGPKLDIVSGHYSDTFSILQVSLRKRDRLFFGVLLLLFLMLFQLYTPSDSSRVFSEVLSEKVGLKEPLDFIYIQSAIWFLLLATTVKYFQSVVFIERQYDYIHQLEQVLAPQFGEKVFTREGSAYLKNYPTFLNWASFLYTVLFPVILLAVPTTKIAAEFSELELNEPLLWFDFAIFVFFLISLGLYLLGKYSVKKHA